MSIISGPSRAVLSVGLDTVFRCKDREQILGLALLMLASASTLMRSPCNIVLQFEMTSGAL